MCEFPEARVLVIDDRPENVTLLTLILTRAGYTNVESTTQSCDAVAMFEAFEPDIVLLDLQMPHPDGYEVMAAMRELTPAGGYLPIVILTADGSEETRTRAFAASANDFLGAHIQYAETVLRVGNLLRTRMLHTVLQRHLFDVQSELDRTGLAEREAYELRQQLIVRARQAIGGPGLQMVYQPVVRLHDGAVIGAEALARFSSLPERSPDVWFSEAASVGLGTQLEIKALELAAAGFSQLPAQAYLAVNASPLTVLSPQIADVIGNVPAERLVIEITEHERIGDDKEFAEALQVQRDKGVRIAVDDAGIGYSGLKRILQLSPDIIKIDRELITDIDHDPARRAMVNALVQFAADTRAQLVAEGIETSAELATLDELGVEFGQGYLLGRPKPLPPQTADIESGI